MRRLTAKGRAALSRLSSFIGQNLLLCTSQQRTGRTVLSTPVVDEFVFHSSRGMGSAANIGIANFYVEIYCYMLPFACNTQEYSLKTMSKLLKVCQLLQIETCFNTVEKFCCPKCNVAQCFKFGQTGPNRRKPRYAHPGFREKYW